jgi:DUF1680 family protein
MKKIIPQLLVAIAQAALIQSLPAAEAAKPQRLEPVPVSQVVIEDDFWSPKIKQWREVTIPDCLDKFEKDRGGAVNNFDLVRDGKTGKHAGPEFFDGLLYETIRGAADFLAVQRDAALEARLDGYIQRIAEAQAKSPDGYINTWTQTLGSNNQRWGMNGGNDVFQHDVYNAGALIEAGVHYYRATGRPALLAVATRMANLMCETIGPPPKANVIPGHSITEEALVNLYCLYRDVPEARKAVAVPVDERRYLQLAEFFIDARGHYEGRTSRDKSYGDYSQDHAPLADQKTIEGHAVRATLFCTGIAAAARADDRPDYNAAACRLCDSFVRHKMYITGAAGAIGGEEKFGPDYFLPNDGYMETCAAIGGGFFNHNMNLLSGESPYVDDLERALYNAALGGIGLTGNQYYYQNPLIGDSLRRWEWHGCPCCPPMFLKIMGALPGYIYAQQPDAAYVNLYIGSHAKLTLAGTKVSLRQTTRYPWSGQAKFAIEAEKPAEFDLMIRIPAWCQGESTQDDLYRILGRPAAGAVKVCVNGQPVEPIDVERGYAKLHRTWNTGDVVELTLDMPVREVLGNPGIDAARGLVALMRGPLVYCAESPDNPTGLRQLIVTPEATFTTEFKPELLGGVEVVRGKVLARTVEEGKAGTAPAELTAIPFYASANREPCAMRVWLAASPDKTVKPTIAERSRPSASHCWPTDTLAGLNDQREPATSDDLTIPRFTWWDHRGTKEWVQYDFEHPTKVSAVDVYWWDERRIKAQCRVPQSWQLLRMADGKWQPVTGASEFGTDMDRFNRVTFDPVETAALRIEVQLQPEWSGGILEWKVSAPAATENKKP